ncbi:MAG: hypothetical protein AB1696_10515 [Planctomycetota bacterium]
MDPHVLTGIVAGVVITILAFIIASRIMRGNDAADAWPHPQSKRTSPTIAPPPSQAPVTRTATKRLIVPPAVLDLLKEQRTDEAAELLCRELNMDRQQADGIIEALGRMDREGGTARVKSEYLPSPDAGTIIRTDDGREFEIPEEVWSLVRQGRIAEACGTLSEAVNIDPGVARAVVDTMAKAIRNEARGD